MMLRFPQVYERTEPASQRECHVVRSCENRCCLALLDARREEQPRTCPGPLATCGCLH
jgi:hypothetical protein